MYKKFLILLVAMLLPWSVAEVYSQGGYYNTTQKNNDKDKDSHEGHDHGSEQEVDEHEGHDHGSELSTNADDHDDELVVELSPEAMKLAGIKISDIRNGSIGSTIELPGEIGFNEDRLAHIAPRFAGIAINANYRVGDYVEVGKIVAVVESNESLNAYSIKAPISGWIIERHITPGEYVSEENSIFVIADLSTVWVNLAVYPKDASKVKEGQSVDIIAIGSNEVATGIIDFITPIMDFKTRSATARISLPNNNNLWRPGTFVQATIITELGSEGVIVEKDAVQFLDEVSVIFVVDGPNKFKPVEITSGESNSHYIQILSDLDKDTQYVSKGAFDLKAKIVTSNMDAHAGHSH